jgi:hypothetical protein
MPEPETTPLKHDVRRVEASVLKLAADMHPKHLRIPDFLQLLESSTKDDREVRTALGAIQNLREFGALSSEPDGSVKLTPSALRGIHLLA